MKRSWKVAVLAFLALDLLAALVLLFFATGSRWSAPDDVDRAGSGRPDARPERQAVADAEGSGGRKTASSTPTIAQVARIESGSRVRIASTSGLPLAVVDVEVRSGWERRELEEGALLSTRTLALPIRVRSPGHVPATLGTSTTEMLLDPDALLTLTAPRLREHMGSVLPQVRFGMGDIREQALAWTVSGFADENRWCLAVQANEFHHHMGFPNLDVAATAANGNYVGINFESAPGLRAECPIDPTWLAPERPPEPLEVATSGARSSERFRIELDCLQLGSRGDNGLIAALDTDWGTVHVQRPLIHEEATLSAPDGKVVIENVPTNLEYCLTALGESSASYGRLLFVHDGSPHTIELQVGSRLVGRLVPPRGSQIPRTADFSWWVGFSVEEARRESESRDRTGSDWYAEARQVPLGADGSFEIRVPTRVPAFRESRWPLPPFAKLAIHAPGYAAIDEIRRIDAEGWYSFGALPLVGRVAALRLAPGHGLTAKETERLQGLSMIPEGAALDYMVEEMRPMQDEALDVYFEPALSPPTGPPSVRAFDSLNDKWREPSWPEPAPAYLIFRNDMNGRGFRLGGDGAYHRIDSGRYEIVLSVDDTQIERRKLRFGWSWRGAAIRMYPTEPSGPIFREPGGFQAPADGVSFWWTTSGTWSSSGEGVHAVPIRRGNSVEINVP